MTETAPRLPLWSALLALGLLGAIGVGSLVDLFDGPGTPQQERVAATPPPPQSLGALSRWVGPARYHLTERYALKDRFITLGSLVRTDLLGHDPYPRVARGQEGFLFLMRDSTLAPALGDPSFRPDPVPDWRAYFETVSAEFAALEVAFVFLLAPSKHTVYADMLPPWIGRVARPDGRTGAVLAAAQGVLDPVPLDLRPLFAEARATDPGALFYHRTDTHWNEAGAALALAAVLPGRGPDPAPVTEMSPRGGDLARMSGRAGRLTEAMPVLPRPTALACTTPGGAPIELQSLDPLLPPRFTCTGGAGQGHLLAFIDSFGVSALPYLVTRFATLDVVWQDDPDLGTVAALDPDLVLQILVERKIYEGVPEVRR